MRLRPGIAGIRPTAARVQRLSGASPAPRPRTFSSKRGQAESRGRLASGRVDSHRLDVRRPGLRETSQHAEGIAQVDAGLNEHGLDCDSDLAMGQSLLGPAQLRQQCAEVRPGLCQPRIELGRSAEMLQGQRLLAHGADDDPSIHMDGHILRAQRRVPCRIPRRTRPDGPATARPGRDWRGNSQRPGATPRPSRSTRPPSPTVPAGSGRLPAGSRHRRSTDTVPGQLHRGAQPHPAFRLDATGDRWPTLPVSFERSCLLGLRADRNVVAIQGRVSYDGAPKLFTDVEQAQDGEGSQA